MKLGRVDLNLLVVLDALLREKNVTRAAESLYLSQPATSTALARLRRVLGDELLYKNGRYLELTPRAESLIEPVREVLATIEQSIVRPPTFDPTADTRRFSVVGSDYVGVTLVRPLLARLSGLATGLRLDAAPVGARYLDALQRDEIDLAILPDRIVRSVPAGLLADPHPHRPLRRHRVDAAPARGRPAHRGPAGPVAVPGVRDRGTAVHRRGGTGRGRLLRVASSPRRAVSCRCPSCWPAPTWWRCCRNGWPCGWPGRRTSGCWSRRWSCSRCGSRRTGTPVGTATRATSGSASSCSPSRRRCSRDAGEGT